MKDTHSKPCVWAFLVVTTTTTTTTTDCLLMLPLLLSVAWTFSYSTTGGSWKEMKIVGNAESFRSIARSLLMSLAPLLIPNRPKHCHYCYYYYRWPRKYETYYTNTMYLIINKIINYSTFGLYSLFYGLFSHPLLLLLLWWLKLMACTTSFAPALSLSLIWFCWLVGMYA